MIYFLTWNCDKNKNPNNKTPKIPGKSQVYFRKDRLKKSLRQVLQEGPEVGTVIGGA